MTVYLSPLLLAIVGLLMFFFAKPPKVEQIGLVVFGVGLLAFMLGVPHGRWPF